jgi:hypothetical protein
VRRAALLGALLLAPGALAQEPTDPGRWLLRTSRMEGAAVDVAEAAQAFGAAARSVGEDGYLHRLAELKARATVLNRQVASARLAAEVLDEP